MRSRNFKIMAGIKAAILWCLLLGFFNVSTRANHHDEIIISPNISEVVRYVKSSLIMTCSGQLDAKVQWLSPNNDVVSEKNGSIHVQEMLNGRLALVFEEITLSDNGKWSCFSEDTESKKSFDLVVIETISFVNTPTVQTVRNGLDAFIRCEANGDPPPTVAWFFTEQEIMPGGKFMKVVDGLVIKNVSKNDAGEYTCRAYQISEVTSDMVEITIRLIVQYKAIIAPRKASADAQYAYLGGFKNLSCEAEAEPQATFTWYRNDKKLSPKNHAIYNGNHTSYLQINVNDSRAFGEYKCKATNLLGNIDRLITLQEGNKPDTPAIVELRGVNTDTFDIDVGAVRPSNIRHEMDIEGYLFEILPQQEFLANGKKWDTARRIPVDFEDGTTYLIGKLTPNTTYVVRVASLNPAGLSDWTETKRFATYPREPNMYSSSSYAFEPLITSNGYVFLFAFYSLVSFFLPA